MPAQRSRIRVADRMLVLLVGSLDKSQPIWEEAFASFNQVEFDIGVYFRKIPPGVRVRMGAEFPAENFQGSLLESFLVPWSGDPRWIQQDDPALTGKNGKSGHRGSRVNKCAALKSGGIFGGDDEPLEPPRLQCAPDVMTILLADNGCVRIDETRGPVRIAGGDQIVPIRNGAPKARHPRQEAYPGRNDRHDEDSRFPQWRER